MEFNSREQLAKPRSRNRKGFSTFSLDKTRTQRPVTCSATCKKNATQSMRKTFNDFFVDTHIEYDETLHGMLLSDVVGPGAYEVPKLIGFKKMCTSYVNAPCYTFARKVNTKKLFISKSHCRVLRYLLLENGG